MNTIEKRPNFLIITAPKTGSTSLVNYLREHPQIYIPEPGEPRYFIREIIKNLPDEDRMKEYLLRTSFLTWDSYIKLFSDAGKQDIMLGEGTTQYLYYYNEIISEIKEKLGDIPIIILLRNPIDRAYSNYNFHPSGEYLNFEDALINEAILKEKGFFSFSLYKEQGLYCKAVQAYKTNFSKVYFLLTDELKNMPVEKMQELYSFLGVDDKFLPDIEKKHNITIIPRNKIVHYFIYFFKKYNIKIFFLSKNLKKKIYQLLFKKNDKRMSEDTKTYLKSFYKKDIQCLEREMNKNLSKWYK